MLAQGSDLAPMFGDLSQIEKLFEIKPPLIILFVNIQWQIKGTLENKGKYNDIAYGLVSDLRNA